MLSQAVFCFLDLHIYTFASHAALGRASTDTEKQWWDEMVSSSPIYGLKQANS